MISRRTKSAIILSIMTLGALLLLYGGYYDKQLIALPGAAIVLVSAFAAIPIGMMED